MGLPTDLTNAINSQITRERTNSGTYSAMGAILDARNLFHASEFMKRQADGEWEHAKKLAAYLGDRDEIALFDAVPPTLIDPGTACVQLFSIALSAEQSTTQHIVDLYRLAESMDPLTSQFLLWFLNEQVEEEKVVSEVLAQFNYYPIGSAEGFVNDYIGENMERLFPK